MVTGFRGLVVSGKISVRVQKQSSLASCRGEETNGNDRRFRNKRALSLSWCSCLLG